MGRVAKYGGRRGQGPLKQLGRDAPAVIKAAAQQLGDKSVKTRTGALQLLQELVAIQPDSMQAHVGALLPPLLAILNVSASPPPSPPARGLDPAGAACDASAWKERGGGLFP